MKKEPGRVRHVTFEDETFVSVDDIIDQLKIFEEESVKRNMSVTSTFNLFKRFLRTILASTKRQIPGAKGDFKRLWSDKGCIN